MATAKAKKRGKHVAEPLLWEKAIESYGQIRRKVIGVAAVVIALVVLTILATWYSGKVERDAASEFEAVAFLDPGSERTEGFRTLAEKYAGKPLGLRAKYRLAADYLEEGRTEEARSLFQEIAEQSSRSYFVPMSWKLLGDISREEGNLDEAMEKYRHVTEVFPDTVASAASWLELGSCYEQQENWEKAREAYEFAAPSFQTLASQRLTRVQDRSGISPTDEVQLDLGQNIDLNFITTPP